MKKQRKENNNKVNVFKVLVKTLIFSILLKAFYVGLAISMFVWLTGGIENFNTLSIHQDKIVLSTLLFMFCCVFLFMFFTSDEKRKISKKFAEDILSKDTYIEVYPKEGHLKYHQHFFYRGLPDKAKYYQTLVFNFKI